MDTLTTAPSFPDGCRLRVRRVLVVALIEVSSYQRTSSTASPARISLETP